MVNELHAQWGQRLKRARKERDISLSAITAHVGLHKSHYCRIEAGEVVPTDDVRIRVASALRMRVEELFPYPPTEDVAPCPYAANAQDGAESPTPPTSAAPPSRARSATEPGESANAGTPTEGGA